LVQWPQAALKSSHGCVERVEAGQYCAAISTTSMLMPQTVITVNWMTTLLLWVSPRSACELLLSA
jgi:hypothetical protein